MTQRTECSGGKRFLIFPSKTQDVTEPTPRALGKQHPSFSFCSMLRPLAPAREPGSICTIPASDELLVYVCCGFVLALNFKEWVEKKLGFSLKWWHYSPRKWAGSVMLRCIQVHGKVRLCRDFKWSFPPILESHSQLTIPLPLGPVLEHLPGRGCCSRENSSSLFLVAFSLLF